MTRRVLIIAYNFPPVGGAGVQRVAKFVKYLPRHGWEPTVLTCANPSVPATDDSLLADIPPNVHVVRARTHEPGYAVKAGLADRDGGQAPPGLVGRARRAAKRALLGLARKTLQPDPQILWWPGAVRAGRALLRSKQVSAVLVSGPPFSSFLVAAHLARRGRVPLVVDYRDEWDLSNSCWENRGTGPLSARLQRRMQASVLRAAAAIVATTQASTQNLDALRREVGGTATAHCIYNGYDRDDIPADIQPLPRADEILRIAYVGTLWNLASIRPLVEALLRIAREQPDVAGRIELVVAGRRTPEQQSLVDAVANTSCRVVQHAYLSHERAVEVMRTADLLCVLLADLPGAQRVAPAKVFEYMALRRSLLVIAPRGELTTIAAQSVCTRVHEPTDVAGIAQCLTRLATNLPASRGSGMGDPPAEYCREHLAGQLATLLNQVSGDHSVQPGCRTAVTV